MIPYNDNQEKDKALLNILLTGADGYLGWPVVLKLSTAFPDDRIIAVDNLARRAWVEEVGAVSGVPIASTKERIRALQGYGHENVVFHNFDLTDIRLVRQLITDYRPEIVLHLAAQPSAPYSEIDAEKASFTQNSNMAMTRNILWALREQRLFGTHFIETTSTGIYGSPSYEIPEGDIDATGSDGRADRVPHPNMASSWYHVSKGFNAVNMRLMHEQTGMPVTDVRTSIVYGADTAETRKAPGFATRFDFDYYFGTIFNRWIVMAVIGEPIIIYGSGNQIKPFIHLEDAVGSLVAIAQKGGAGYSLYNQLTEYIRIGDLAAMIGRHMEERRLPVEIRMVPNPRVEQEDRSPRYRNEKFLRLLSGPPINMKAIIGETVDRLLPHKERLMRYKHRLMK